MYSWFSRLSTARGSGTGLVTVGPTALSPFYSLLGSLEVKIKNTWLTKLRGKTLFTPYNGFTAGTPIFTH